MNCKHVMGVLALILTLCVLVSSYVVINSDDEQSDISLAAPPPVIGPVIEVTYHTNGGIFSDLYDGLNHLSLVSEGLYRGNIDEGNANIYGWQLPLPTRDGHIFAGWYFDEGLNNAAPAEIKLSKDLKSDYYAKWVKPLTADNYNLFDEFGISTVDDYIQFVNLAADHNYAGKTVILTSDLDLTNAEIKYIKSFSGIFDGQGHIITCGITLFDSIPNSGILKNLEVTNTEADGQTSSGIAYTNHGSIINCHFSGTISASNNVGGIASSNHGSIINCHFSGTISGSYGHTGGIVNNNHGTIINCYAAGTINASNYIGGIASSNFGTIINSYFAGTISSTGRFNNAITDNSLSGKIENCYYLAGTVNYEGIGIAKTAAEMQTAAFAESLGAAYQQAPNGFVLNGASYTYPVLISQLGNSSGTATISYNSNGGIGSINESKSEILDNVTLPSSGFTRDNYRLDCWNTSADGTGIEYKLGDTILAYDNLTLYAQWVRQYIVTCITGDENVTVSVDTGSNLPIINVNSENKRLDWWYTDEACTIRYDYTSGVTSDITLYAKWFRGIFAHPAPTTDSYESSDAFEIWTSYDYIVFMNSIDRETEYSGKTVYLARDIDITGTPKVDYPDNLRFAGIFDGQHHSISGSTSAMFYYNMGTIKNLTIKDCVITHIMGGGQSIAGFVYNNGGVIENCCFAGEIDNSRGIIAAGIAANNSGTIKNCCNMGNITSQNDIQATAGIAARNSGTIENCYNAGNITTIERSTNDGSRVAGIAVANTSSGSITNCYNAGIIKHTYSAEPTVNRYPTYAIVVTNEGSITNCYYLENTAKDNGGGTVKTAAEMQTAAFVESLGAAYAKAPSSFMINNAAYTYPVLTWQVFSEFTVDFNSNGGSAVESQTVRDGYTASRPTDPTKSGYIFGGWYTNVELTSEHTFTTPITQNTTLYAKWYIELAFTTVPSIQNIKVTVDGRTITATVVAENYQYLLWDMGDGSEPVKTYTNSITYTYEKNGNYQVKVKAVNNVGESKEINQSIQISEDSGPLSSSDNTDYVLYALMGLALVIFGILTIKLFGPAAIFAISAGVVVIILAVLSYLGIF